MKAAKIEVMTKKLVDSLLEMNTSNRPVKPSVVARYQRDIEAGNWRLTNQGIGVTNDGVLTDGQHRLLALQKAGYPPVECVVVYGLDMEAQRVVDQHVKRSARDIFRLSFNSTVSRLTPAVIQVLAKFEDEFTIEGKRTALTIDEIFDRFEILSDSIESVCSVVVKESYFPAPIVAGCVYFHHKALASTEQIAEFLNQVRLGENLNRKMPAFHMRNYLAASRKSGAGSTVQNERYIKTKKALEAFVSGKEMGVLRV